MEIRVDKSVKKRRMEIAVNEVIETAKEKASQGIDRFTRSKESGICAYTLGRKVEERTNGTVGVCYRGISNRGIRFYIES